MHSSLQDARIIFTPLMVSHLAVCGNFLNTSTVCFLRPHDNSSCSYVKRTLKLALGLIKATRKRSSGDFCTYSTIKHKAHQAAVAFIRSLVSSTPQWSAWVGEHWSVWGRELRGDSEAFPVENSDESENSSGYETLQSCIIGLSSLIHWRAHVTLMLCIDHSLYVKS